MNTANVTKLNITPTWAAAMPLLILLLENGTDEGKQAAREELMRLARDVDKANEYLAKPRNLEDDEYLAKAPRLPTLRNLDDE